MLQVAGGRGVGLVELLHGIGGWPVLVVFALLTQLGDMWFLFLAGGTVYIAGEDVSDWGIDRRRGLFVLATVLMYVALIGALKYFFALPRPPGADVPPTIPELPVMVDDVVTAVVVDTGYGFPSGHALGTTMVWGALALVLDRGTRRLRSGVAGGVVVVVGVSRLVLGVHYAVDVVAGVLAGIVALWCLFRLSDRCQSPGRVLLAVIAVGFVGLVTGSTLVSVIAIGGALGAWVVWQRVDGVSPPQPTTRVDVVIGLIALGVAGSLFALVYTLEPGYPMTVLGSVVAGGVVTGTPLFRSRYASTAGGS